MDIKIIDFVPQDVALLTHKGSPSRLLDTAAQFIAWRKSTGLSPVKTSKTFGIAHNDPAVTKECDFQFDFAGSIRQAIPENQYGVKNAVIPGGRCALVRHFGSHDKIGDTAYYLYRQWLPKVAKRSETILAFSTI